MPVFNRRAEVIRRFLVGRGVAELAAGQLEQLILLCPSARFLASLPGGKIPDRGDFTRLQPAERIAYWRVCIDRSRELADDFGAQLAASDPLRGTRSLG